MTSAAKRWKHLSKAAETSRHPNPGLKARSRNAPSLLSYRHDLEQTSLLTSYFFPLFNFYLHQFLPTHVCSDTRYQRRTYAGVPDRVRPTPTDGYRYPNGHSPSPSNGGPHTARASYDLR